MNNETLKPERIRRDVAYGNIHWSCFFCAKKYRDKEPYNGIYTIHDGKCDICGKTEPIGPANKLFGYYRSRF